MSKQDREDAILKTPIAKRVEIGRKQVEEETIYRFVDVYGNAELGYIASLDEYFSPNREGGAEPEFYEVCFQTTIYSTVDAALADAMPSAIKELPGFLASN